jgi:hypothetical protein
MLWPNKPTAISTASFLFVVSVTTHPAPGLQDFACTVKTIWASFFPLTDPKRRGPKNKDRAGITPRGLRQDCRTLSGSIFLAVNLGQRRSSDVVP